MTLQAAGKKISISWIIVEKNILVHPGNPGPPGDMVTA